VLIFLILIVIIGDVHGEMKKISLNQLEVKKPIYVKT